MNKPDLIKNINKFRNITIDDFDKNWDQLKPLYIQSMILSNKWKYKTVFNKSAAKKIMLDIGYKIKNNTFTI